MLCMLRVSLHGALQPFICRTYLSLLFYLVGYLSAWKNVCPYIWDFFIHPPHQGFKPKIKCRKTCIKYLEMSQRKRKLQNVQYGLTIKLLRWNILKKSVPCFEKRRQTWSLLLKAKQHLIINYKGVQQCWKHYLINEVIMPWWFDLAPSFQ